MTPEEDALFQQAKDLYNAGHRQQAYQQFCELSPGNPEDAALLCWIGYSTPRLEEAERALADIERLKPNHPSLPKLRDRVDKLQQIAQWREANKPLEMTCPYCHQTRAPHTKGKVSVGGWIWFAAFFLLFLGLLAVSLLMASTVVPVTLLAQIQREINSTEGWAFLFLSLSFIGFFIRRHVYTCGNCGIELGNMR